MKSTFLHPNFSVFDLEKSLTFYSKAPGLTEKRRKVTADDSFTLVYLMDSFTDFELEPIWVRDRKEPYNLGDNEIHLAVRVPDKQEAYELHKSMGYIYYESHETDLYFINDPDGYWIEILDR